MTEPYIISFSIPGTPRPKQRARRDPRSGRWFTPVRTEQYEREVAWYTRQAVRRARDQDPGRSFPLDALFRLYVDIYGANVKADVDNILKSISDGITKGQLWADDAKVITSHGDRHPAQEGHKYPRRADVRIYVVGHDAPPKVPRPVGVRPQP